MNLKGRVTNKPKSCVKRADLQCSDYEFYFLIQREFYRCDTIAVNLAYKMDVNGSVRIKPLCLFKVFTQIT